MLSQRQIRIGFATKDRRSKGDFTNCLACGRLKFVGRDRSLLIKGSLEQCRRQASVGIVAGIDQRTPPFAPRRFSLTNGKMEPCENVRGNAFPSSSFSDWSGSRKRSLLAAKSSWMQ